MIRPGRRSGRVALAAATLVSCLVVASASPAAVEAAGNIVQIPAPGGSVAFGSQIHVLANGNYVIIDELAAGGGNVSLYDGTTNALISTLTGSTAGDRVGHEFTDLHNGNFVVSTPFWHRAGVALVGAATWVNGTTGLNGAVSTGNSIVGAAGGDNVGSDVTALANGNYVVQSPSFTNGATSAGAATFAVGTHATGETVGSSNSLVGSTMGSGVGFRVLALRSGDYVVLSPQWSGVGAATWSDGTEGRTGVVSFFNSLIGSTSGDRVGSSAIELSDGDYVIGSSSWQSATNVHVGAATWSSATLPTIGPVTAMNSLVGTRDGDDVGANLTAVGNGNYVVSTSSWDNTAAHTDAGAVTFGHGDGTTHGQVTSGNSLVGTHTNDAFGTGVTVLANGNYVARGEAWLNQDGAVSWGSSTTGTAVGGVDASNSLIGSHSGDEVGFEIVPLTNGNYVVRSPDWANGSAAAAGAATWASGTAPTTGPVTSDNSLVGTHPSDQVSIIGITPLTNGNYVVGSWKWNNGATATVGAATWGSGTTGVHGPVTASNSLIGTTADDEVGAAITPLTNGNYVVGSRSWDGAVGPNVGAITWGNGASGTAGPVTAANSFTGSAPGEGAGGVAALPGGAYVATSATSSTNGLTHNGAIAWLSGDAATSGMFSASDSLTGASDNDSLVDIAPLPNGGFLAVNPLARTGTTFRIGSITLAGPRGARGPVGASNSVVGTLADTGNTLTYDAKSFTRSGGVVVALPAENRVYVMYPSGSADYVSTSPARLVDTRVGFATVDGLNAGTGIVAAGSTLQVTVGGRASVPSDALAAALNVTATEPQVAGFITVYPCGEKQPTASNLNFAPGDTVPNAVFSKLGTNGRVCVYTSQTTQIVIDVDGYFPATTSYIPINPARLIDTRSGTSTVDGLQQGDGQRATASITQIHVAGRVGIPADAATAVLNVTVTEPTIDGFATVYPCGSTPPTASNLNFVAGQTIPNLAVSKIGTGGDVCVFTSQPAQLVADVAGYFPAMSGYHALVPARLLDTRAGTKTIDGQGSGGGPEPLASITPVKVTGRGGVPLDALTVTLNVTATEPQAAGFLTAYPCGISPPLASNVNYAAGQTIPNAVVVKVGADGTVCIASSQSTHLVVDVTGYLAS